jgi:hypothetical protein
MNICFLAYLLGSTPANSWYSEISSYNYSSPGFSSATGHFTQVIWNGSTQLGIGIAFSSNNQSVTVVANYYPAGNVIGSFPAHVPPLCSVVTTVASTTISIAESTNTTKTATTSRTTSSNKTTTSPRTTTTSTRTTKTRTTRRINGR